MSTIFKTISCLLLFIIFCSIIIEGRVAIKGNEPFSYLVIETKHKEYKIVGELRDKIFKKYQNKNIKVKGKIIKKANGHAFPAEFKIVKILKVY